MISHIIQFNLLNTVNVRMIATHVIINSNYSVGRIGPVFSHHEGYRPFQKYIIIKATTFQYFDWDHKPYGY